MSDIPAFRQMYNDLWNAVFAINSHMQTNRFVDTGAMSRAQEYEMLNNMCHLLDMCLVRFAVMKDQIADELGVKAEN